MVSPRAEGQQEDLEEGLGEEEALAVVALGVATVEPAGLELVLGVLDLALAVWEEASVLLTLRGASTR